MLFIRHLTIVFLIGISPSNSCNAGDIYGLIEKSKDGYYFHTEEKNIGDDVWLNLISLNINVRLETSTNSKLRSETDQFHFHSTYAYKIEEHETQKLSLLQKNSFPAIVLNPSNDVTRIDNDSLVSSSCASNEGVHFSIWKKGNYGFERVWSIYSYAGYDTQSSCQEWEYAD